MSGIYRYTQRLHHESPVIFWSLLLGFGGPVMVLTVPPIRRSFGYKSSDPVPNTYPIPNRARQPVITPYGDA